MKKVLIVTLFGNYNYGNKFQNYALQKVLERYNLEVNTLNMLKIKRKELPQVSCWERIKKITLKKLVNKAKNYFNRNINKQREISFAKFSNKYINTYDFVSDIETDKTFDKICLGSDQIWKPLSCDSHFAYAHFVNKEKVFSYAASFGISNIKDEHKQMVIEGLMNVNDISVREQRGSEIVQELVQKKAEVLVDPTMLLTQREWNKILEQPTNMPPKDFILTYFLGEYSSKRKKYIKEFAKKNDYDIVDLGKADIKKYYCTSPGEFIYFVKKAKGVFTDSFHGAVFSILYKTPFFIFEREDGFVSMNSRLETLLNKFEFEERKLKDYTQKISLDMDFKNTDEILKIEREKSDKFLRKALNIKENEVED